MKPINDCVITRFVKESTVPCKRRFFSCSEKILGMFLNYFYFFLYIYVTTITIITNIIIQEKNSHQMESRGYLQKFVFIIQEKERQRKVLFTETEILVKCFFFSVPSMVLVYIYPNFLPYRR